MPAFPFAKHLRKNMTPAEVKMWQKLRCKRTGFKFQHQKPILFYYADFFCPKYALIVEIDGPIHNKLKEYDKERDSNLSKAGFKILRFTNDQVFNCIDQVIAKIVDYCKSQKPTVRPLGNTWSKRQALKNKGLEFHKTLKRSPKDN